MPKDLLISLKEVKLDLDKLGRIVINDKRIFDQINGASAEAEKSSQNGNEVCHHLNNRCTNDNCPNSVCDISCTDSSC